MVEWIKNFIIPLIEITFIFGVVGVVLFIVIRAFNKVFSTQWKWFFKYKIFRRKYDEKTVAWILEAISNDLGYWDAKKFLMIKMVEEERINEIMWVYERMLKQLQGGLNRNGQRITSSNRQTQSIQSTLNSTNS